jgi:Glycosyl transferase family 11
MSELVSAMLSSFNKRFNLYHNNLIHIEGGLGSQILGAIAFWNLQAKLGEENVRCDLSYFSQEAQSKGLWPYELEKFNVSISEFKKFESTSKWSILKAKRDFLTNDELAHHYWEESRSRFQSKFDYDRNEIFKYFREIIELELDEPFTAIHIRRGDYLQVASKIINVDEYFQLLKVLSNLLFGKVLIISDSVVSDEDRSKLQKVLHSSQVIYLDAPGLDAFRTHCLLREAKLLITANSTYSFSAGLLGRQGQMVFSPMQFHSGQGSEKYNRSFRSAGSFFAWSKRS